MDNVHWFQYPTNTVLLITSIAIAYILGKLGIKLRLFNSRNTLTDKQLEQLLSDLHSEDYSIRDNAQKKLRDISIKHKQLPQVYEAILKSYTDDNSEYFSSRSQLIEKLWKTHDKTTIEFIFKHYKELPQNPGIRSNALRTLSEINTSQSLEHLSTLILQDKQTFIDSNRFASIFRPIQNHGNSLKLLAPTLVKLSDEPTFREDTYSLFISLYKQNQSLTEQQINTITIYLSKDLLPRLSASDSTGPQKKLLAEIALDLIGYLPQDEQRLEMLKQYATHPIARLQFYTYLSLKKRKQAIPDKLVFDIASKPETRGLLFDHLDYTKQLDQFPEQFRNQDSLAESNMVNWLEHPAELGTAPEEIQLIEKRSYDDNNIPSHIYLYKYCHQEFKDNQWMVGWSGPHPDGELNTSSPNTFSNFTLFSEKSINEHFKDAIPNK